MLAKIDKAISEIVINKLISGDEIVSEFKESKSGIIEILGFQGSGKSIFFDHLYHIRKEFESEPKFYLPSLFKINQFKEFLQFLFDIDDDYYKGIIKKASAFDFDNKFDFFYFLLDNLVKDKKIYSQSIVLYETFYLDNYTLKFIEYFAEYISDIDKLEINFLIFSRKKQFSFSKEYKIKRLSLENISDILSYITDEDISKVYSTSIILKKLTKNSIYTLSYILKKNFISNQGLNFDDSWLNKDISLSSLYEDEFKTLPVADKEILYEIYLMGKNATESALKDLLSKTDVKKKLNYFIKNEWLFNLDDIYYLKKLLTIKLNFDKLSATEQNKIAKRIQKFIEEDFDELFYKCCKKTTKLSVKFYNYLKIINDNKNLMELYSDILKTIKESLKKVEYLKKLAKISKKLNKWEMASEYLRKALQIALQIAAPAEEIIYNLADTFLNMNSASFALEIIKKYSPKDIDKFWEWRIYLLKSKILTESEDFEEALENISKANHISVDEKVLNKRIMMGAEEHKQRGLVYYFSNEINKAEEEFEESLNLFKKIKDSKGLAALYNNIGGIAIFKGNWKEAENLFLKSLKFEQKSYNLNGIAYSYNNLGSLLGDKAENEKAIKYLSEALKIQKLLNDRSQISIFYFNIGLTYMDIGNFEKAEESLEKSLEIALMFNLSKNIDVALNALGAFYFKSGNWTKAIEYYKDAIKKAKANNFFEGLSQSYNNLGELYEKREEYELAYDYYMQSKEFLSNFSDDFLKAKIYGNLGSALTRLHRFAEAYPYLAESYDFFKKMNISEELIEAINKMAYYFYMTKNLESSLYYVNSAIKEAEKAENHNMLGLAFLYKSYLETDRDEKMKLLKKASEYFVEQKGLLELAQANYYMAEIMFEQQEWEQALQLLDKNKKIIVQFGAVKFLEKNDNLIDRIKSKYEIQMKESRQQETLLAKFYEITQKLNELSDIELLIETALNELIDFSTADGGVFCLYRNKTLKNGWEYLHSVKFETGDKNYNNIMNMIEKSFIKKEIKNLKQPGVAPEYSNILLFPLIARNNQKGVIALFIKDSIRYFPEAIINLLSALSNQIIVIVENIAYKNMEKRHAIIREELKDKGAFTNIIGKSNPIKKIFNLINKIKDTSITVLIEGPSGTGKELIAKAIHYNSNRKSKNFIAQYCGALPETLLESELFGHVKGSFTGATHDKKGLFEIADGGTFFLDEIADISLSTQAKLLRVLQEGEIKKVGSTITQKVDVRVICATNVSLKQRVDEGKFREDLYYRLNVIKIQVPSLKDRKTDIPLLIVHFLDKYSKKIGKNIKGINDQAMKYLIDYDWPGNIRQLENEIERTVTLADNDSYIEPSDLSEEIYNYKKSQEVIDMLNPKSMKESVEKLEYEMILKALEETNWNQTKTSQKLGLSRQGLIKKLHRYNIKRDNEN